MAIYVTWLPTTHTSTSSARTSPTEPLHEPVFDFDVEVINDSDPTATPPTLKPFEVKASNDPDPTANLWIPKRTNPYPSAARAAKRARKGKR